MLDCDHSRSDCVHAALLALPEKRANTGPAAFDALDLAAPSWQNARVPNVVCWRHESFPAQILHLVEFADIRDPILDLDVWRICRRRAIRQPLLSYPRRQD